AEQAFFKATDHFSNNNPNDPDQRSGSEEPWAPGTVRARLSGKSTLVFRIPSAIEEVSYSLDAILDWTQWEQVVSKAAVGPGQPRPEGADHVPSADRIRDVTKIELPYRLYLSPHSRSGWITPRTPVRNSDGEAIELWQARLGVRQLATPSIAQPVTTDNNS